ncbi:MAG: hypothetical protein HUJ92_04765 [Bacteroidales bacterium]|nr:hypothetical protein [Bacteroidales bacterium]
MSDNKELTFSELYGNEGTSNLQKMMQYLAIEEYEDETESEEEDDDANEENGRNEGNTTQKDFSTYRINGQGEYRKRTLPFETIKKYVGQHPEKNATDILNELRTIKAENPVLPYNFIADETEYSNLSSDAKGRVKALNVNGENIYISNQWKFDNIKKFIEVVNNSNWGILIESVSTNN